MAPFHQQLRTIPCFNVFLLLLLFFGGRGGEGRGNVVVILVADF